MKEAFRERKFSESNLALLDKAQDKIEDYDRQGITMTLRQLYYQLVSSDVIPNNIKAYKHLTSLITDARYAGIIDWDAIDDNLRKPKITTTFSGIPELLRNAIHWYELNYWEEMENYVELYTEKDALSSILAPIARANLIPFQVNRGYASASSMYEAAQRFIENNDKHCVILYLGDHDPSGLDMVRDISERLSEFGADVEVKHIALTREQIQRYKPPPNPAKLSDARAQSYISEHGDESWECDALPPNVMIKLVKDALEEYIDEDIKKDVLEQEAKDKQKLLAIAKKNED